MTIMTRRYFGGILASVAATLGTAKDDDVAALLDLTKSRKLDVDEHAGQMAKPMFNYVTTGEWGLTSGKPLTAAEVDENFWRIEQTLRKMDALLRERGDGQG